MAGLLGDFEDPRQQGLLALGLGLLNSRGNFGQGLGQAGMQAMDVMRQATQDQQRRKVLEQQQQMQALQMQAAQQQLAEQQRIAGMRDKREGFLGRFNANAGPTPGFNPAEAMLNGLTQDDMALLGPQSKPKPMVLTPGATVYDPEGNKPVFTAPDKPEAPPEIVKLMKVRDSLPPNDPNRAVLDAAITKATTHQPGTSVSVNTGQRGLDNTLKLRGDFRSEPVYKAHQEMQSAYAQIDQSLKQATPAGDLAAATKIMKLLDPGSVVRESELGMAMAATGLMDRATNYANMIVTGQKLTPKQRVEFKQLADALYSESVGQYNAKRSEYEGIASRNGLSVPDVLGPVSDKPLPKPAQKQPARAMQKNVVVDF